MAIEDLKVLGKLSRRTNVVPFTEDTGRERKKGKARKRKANPNPNPNSNRKKVRVLAILAMGAPNTGPVRRSFKLTVEDDAN